MSWIAEYDTQGREFPACVHVTKTTDFMTHGATYVPIEDGKAVRDENARLRELLSDYQTCTNRSCPECRYYDECFDGNHVACCIAIDILDKRAQEFGIGVRDELGTQVQP